MATTNLSPTYRIAKTLFGVAQELERSFGVTPRNDTQGTLNRKYNIVPDQIPPDGVLTRNRYFGIGINGCYNVDAGNLTEPRIPLATNMDLYTPIPFRCVPREQDLSPAERLLYRMRVPEMINGVPYISYYLKVMTLGDTSVRFTITDPTTKTESIYTPSYANLSPTPPAAAINGVVSATANEVNATIASSFPVTGAEVVEAIAVKYGDLRRAKISEYGVYSGHDAQVQATDYTNTAFNYTEAILATLTTHYTFNGVDMSVPSATSNHGLRYGKGEIILV